jgi:hypothetical protein
MFKNSEIKSKVKTDFLGETAHTINFNKYLTPLYFVTFLIEQRIRGF